MRRVPSYFAFFLSLFILASCVRMEKIVDGETAYDRKYFSDATRLLEDEYNSVRDDQTKAYKAYLLAKSYKKMGQVRNAASWLKKSYDAYPSEKTLEEYAYTIKMLGEYDQAILVYENLSASDRARSLAEIAVCRNAKKWVATPNPKYEVKKISRDDVADQYATDLRPDNRLIVTYSEATDEPDSTYHWTGNTFYKVGTKMGGSGSIRDFEEFAVTSPYNVSDLVIYDSIAFYTTCEDDFDTYDLYCKIRYRIKEEGGYWSEPMDLPFAEPNRNYFHPSYDQNKGILYFSSNHGLDSVQYDLYAMRYDEEMEESWTEMVMIEELCANTSNEMYPRVYGDTLFYSSDNTSMGGLDIFMSSFDKGRWGPPQNLRAPINSPSDDFGLVLNRNRPGPKTFSGYLTSSRANNVSDDLYEFGPNRNYDDTKDPSDNIIATETEDPKEDSIEVRIITYERIYNKNGDPSSGTREIVGMSDVKTVVDASPYVDTTMMSGYAGNMKIKVPQNLLTLEVTGSKRDYLTVQKFIDFQQVLESGDPKVELILEPIVYEKEIVLENIYFDFDQFDIRADARPSLDSLSTLLKLNPTINIELSSHTDCHGTIGYNMDLSNKRAYSTMQYLVERGVPQERMTARGYGESQPRINCDCDDCTDAEDQMNRRTSFRILSN